MREMRDGPNVLKPICGCGAPLYKGPRANCLFASPLSVALVLENVVTLLVVSAQYFQTTVDQEFFIVKIFSWFPSITKRKNTKYIHNDYSEFKIVWSLCSRTTAVDWVIAQYIELWRGLCYNSTSQETGSLIWNGCFLLLYLLKLKHKPMEKFKGHQQRAEEERTICSMQCWSSS